MEHHEAPNPTEQDRTVQHSQRQFDDLQALVAFPPFRRFMDRLDGATNEMAAQILEGEMPLEEREKLRIRRLGMVEVLRKPADEIGTHVGILQENGVFPLLKSDS